MDNRRVRVRFAPSPTGPLHIGGVRTALFNYLFARKHGGDFLLRIEDTDSNRFVPGAEAYIVEALKWCGIEIDEGVSVGGPHEPYRQSERRAIYKKYADQLVASGNAYYAFDTPEELDALRLRYETEGKTFTYNYEIRNTLSTSIVLSAEEVKRRIDAGDGWVIRFKMPVNEEVEMFDLIRDRVVVNTSTLDDKVLFKSADMLPTYHLANVVDDYLMEISHVIRGEEWLPSLPLHASSTAEEILLDFPDGFDYLVTGVGTGGHISGVAKILKQHFPKIQIVAVEPTDSPVIGGGKPGPHSLQGIGAGFIPKNLSVDLVDRVIGITKDEAYSMVRRTVKEEGLLVGISSGASLAAISKIVEEKCNARIITFSYDSGERYLSVDGLF